MKIGIITQPLHTNYGGLLQNYALQQVLKRLGYEPITLDQCNTSIPRWRIVASYVMTFLLRLIGKGEKRLYPCQRTDIISHIRQKTNRFINKHITHTGPFQSTKEFRNYTINQQLDALVVGSDQVWRPIYNQNLLRSFLDFAEDLKLKRLVYAASFGVDYWEFTQKQTLQAQHYINTFDAVSVREHSGIDLCRKYLHCNAVHVLDPTLLLNKEDYIKLVEDEKEQLSKGELFTYILDNTLEKQAIIEKVATVLSLEPFTSMPVSTTDIYPSVTQWLRSFIDAKFVVCDSFHGAVFSIIFNKPFLIISNKERGMARFESLLDTFELRNRMTTEIIGVDSVISTPVDWEKVNRIRIKMKIFSIEFLKSNLQ